MENIGRSRVRAHKLYNRWGSMRQRCGVIGGNSSYAFCRYAGRGITVQESWKHDYKAFRDYCYSLYPNLDDLLKENYHLDRIDNDGNYEEGNIRFVTARENANNTCRSKYYSLEGEKLTISQAVFAGKSVVGDLVVRDRMNKGWDFKEALTTPIQRKSITIQGKKYTWEEIEEINKLKISHKTISSRKKAGWSLEEILSEPGKKFRPKSELEDLIGDQNVLSIPIKNIQIRLWKGWSLEEALNVPFGRTRNKWGQGARA